MAKYFSPSNCTFYDTDIINQALMPSDVVPVSDSDYQNLMNEQCNGKVIVADENGNPVAQTQNCNVCNCLIFDITGEVRWFARKTAPETFLVCNGQAVSRTEYKELFSAIGTVYGSGDGSTTFNVPNLIGKTVWGGNEAEVGTELEAGLPNITGDVRAGTHGYIAGFDGAFYKRGGTMQDYGQTDTSTQVYSGFKFDASKSNNIYGKSDTVQPPALVLLPCIKAKPY